MLKIKVNCLSCKHYSNGDEVPYFQCKLEPNGVAGHHRHAHIQSCCDWEPNTDTRYKIYGCIIIIATVGLIIGMIIGSIGGG